MDLSTTLRMFSGSQTIITDIYAETGDTNNYGVGAFTTTNSYNTSYFDGIAPTSLTGLSTNGNYQTSYSVEHTTNTTLSFDWYAVASGTNTVTVYLSNVVGTPPEYFDYLMSYTPPGGGSSFQEGGFASRTDTTITFTTSTPHSVSPTPYYSITFLITMNGGSYYLGTINPSPPSNNNLSGYSASGTVNQTTDSYSASKTKLFFRFNTSFIGPTATVDEAKIYLYTSSIAYDNAASVNLYVPSGWPPTILSSVLYNNGSLLTTSKAISSLTNLAYNEFVVAPTLINKTSITDCRLQVDAPSQPILNTKTNSFSINLNGSTRPYMRVRFRV